MADTKISGLSSASAVADTDIIPIVSGGVNYKATRASLFTGTVTLLTNGASNKGLIVKGASSQSGNLIEYQDNLGNTLGAVTSSANLLVSQVSALTPASGAGNSIIISGSAAVGTNTNGGNVVLTGGAKNGSGADGQVVLTRNGTSSAPALVWSDLATGFYRSGFSIYAVGSGTILGGFSASGGIDLGPNQCAFASSVTGTRDAGLTRSAAAVIKATNGSSGLGALICGQPATGTVGLVVQAITSATANLQEWQNSSGTVRSSVGGTNGFQVYDGSGNLQGAFGFYVANGSGFQLTRPGDSSSVAAGLVATPGGGYVAIFGGTITTSLSQSSGFILSNSGQSYNLLTCGTTGGVVVLNQAAANKALVVQAATSQTANLLECQNNGGTALTTVTKDGYITAPKISSGGNTPLLIPSHSTTLTTDSDAVTITFNLATSNDHLVVLGGNRTLALSNDQIGQKFSIILQQDGVGSRTVTWWSGISWSGGSTPTLTTTANKSDVFTFWKIGAGSYLGFITGQNL